MALCGGRVSGADAESLILGECWNTFGDVGAAARSSTRKLIDLENLAIARRGTDARVGLVWIVRATAQNRELIARYPEIFTSRFPGSSRAWIAALATGTTPPAEPGLCGATSPPLDCSSGGDADLWESA